MNGIRVIDFHGSHREIGKQHGEECRNLINDFLGDLRENVITRIKAKYDEKLMQDWIRKDWAYSVEYDSLLNDELEGIALGANMEVLEIVFLNAFLDIVNARDDRSAATLLGCTSFAATQEATKDNKVYIGQNYDMEAFYNKYKILMRISATNEPINLIYSYAGIVGCAGLNSEGIGLCINFLHARDAAFGSLYPFRVRKILSQTRIGDAIGASTIGARAGGVNFLIGDKSGLVVSVETTAKEHDIIFARKGILAHTNHYLSPHLRNYDLLIWDSTYDSGISRRGSTITRYITAMRFLEKNWGDITIEKLKELASDQTNFPFSICCSGLDTDSDLLRGETNASFLLDLQERNMAICSGIPSAGKTYRVIPVLK